MGVVEVRAETKSKTLRGFIRDNLEISEIILSIVKNIESLDSNESEEEAQQSRMDGIRGELQTININLHDAQIQLEKLYKELSQ